MAIGTLGSREEAVSLCNTMHIFCLSIGLQIGDEGSLTSVCHVLPVVCDVMAPPAALQLTLLDYKSEGIYHRHLCVCTSGV